MWLWTARRFGITSSAWLGRMSTKRGRIVAKYGAFRVNAIEKIRFPWGRRLAFCQRSSTAGMAGTLPARTKPVWPVSPPQV